ncbi:MAG TPA: hypothetical protein VFU17_13875 [Candidatus Limnocylindrales bacterium]|nr:hypothetical protein [Candidatus Limnocylindrales bacterium]
MRRLYQLAYTEIQQTGKAGRLNTLNSQIGFYRNAAAALILAAVLHAGVQVFGEAKLPIYPWVPLYAGCGVLFAFRYRRYWRQFGDNVIRGIRVIDRRPTISEPSKTSLGSTSSGMEH